MLGLSPGDPAYSLLSRVHRSYIRGVVAVSIVVLGAWSLWLASRSESTRPVATQSALMGRFVAVPGSERPFGSGVSIGAGASTGQLTGAAVSVPASGAPQGFVGGTGDPSTAVDLDGDGVPDERPANPLEARLSAIQKQIDDSDYEFRKKFKTTAALLEAYKKEIDTLKNENARLNQTASGLTTLTSGISGRIASAEGQARSASISATEAREYASQLGTNLESLSATVDDHVRSLEQADRALEGRADEQQSTTEAIASDLDTTSREMQARTERLGERATDLAERTEQIAGLQRTMYAALIGEYDRQVSAIEQKADFRMYRMFNKKEGRSTIDDLRRRLQSVRAAMLAGSVEPDARNVIRYLEALQSRLNRIAPKFE